MGETTAVAHGEGLCAEPASAPCKPRGNPQDRAASPRPRCIACQQFKIIRLVIL
ncbi:MAG: hypothetical protein F6J90_37630 [Moorea sp. SIOASIH]|uniref:hypothetical protein n=1 Tax=Moorena sp. SIOASIH TaxID=2607817 RepID=UPI0013B76E15|nr:hypothetical protein [Moorena sp. SIOASIH]NEO41741.1 hypothetical protein [Moorena sp. SIOASIH]